MLIVRGRYSINSDTQFKLDIFCISSKLDKILKEHLTGTEESVCKVFLQSLLLKPKL